MSAQQIAPSWIVTLLTTAHFQDRFYLQKSKISASFAPWTIVADQDNGLSWNVCSPSDESHHLHVQHHWVQTANPQNYSFSCRTYHFSLQPRFQPIAQKLHAPAVQFPHRWSGFHLISQYVLPMIADAFNSSVFLSFLCCKVFSIVFLNSNWLYFLWPNYPW